MNETALLEPETETSAVETSATESSAPSLRDTIAAALDKDETTQEPTAGVEKPTSEPAETNTPAAASAEAKTEPTTEGGAAKAAPVELKAPSQWKPNVREQWNKLPREVQEEIHRREGDSMRLLGSVGPKIRLADEVNGHLQPFVEQFKTNGVSPSAFLGDMFASVKSLSSGSPQERAEVVANIVQSYGVDLRVLDALLTQRLQAGPEVVEARRLAARAQSVLQQQSNSLEHENSLKAEKTLVSFGADPKHEFFDDVRDLMADLIEAGKAANLDDAYAAAIWANADTRKILLQREAQVRAESKTKRAEVARKASSAVHGFPQSSAAPPGIKPNASVREALTAAWDEQTPP